MAACEWKTLLVTTGAAVSDGQWVDASQYRVPYSIHFAGTGVGDTCEIRVSNALTQPLNTAHESLFGTAVNADQTMKVITETYRWIKVRKTAATIATTVTMLAQFLK